MKTAERSVVVRTFTSEVRPEIQSECEGDGDAITWGDAHPNAWRIVTTAKSAVFGRGGCAHLGAFRDGVDAWSTLRRLRELRRHLEAEDPRALFAMEHVRTKGFSGGMFLLMSQWSDGKIYTRCGAVRDFTPETLEAQIDAYLAWCETVHVLRGTEVLLDGRRVRALAGLVVAETEAPPPVEVAVEFDTAEDGAEP